MIALCFDSHIGIEVAKFFCTDSILIESHPKDLEMIC